MKLVVVESPAKAKTINRYLGSDYKVVASFGHVRDLTAKDGSVDPENDFAMLWEIGDRAKKAISEIVTLAKRADQLILATDPDREGEAISWHVLEVLKERKALGDMRVQRVIFHEVTKSAVLDAVANPRELNREMVDAYLARRALDYLVGFTLSPVLWRKLPGARSAGRVQSVALRLVCERESEIERFKKQEYWTVATLFESPRGQKLTARLTHLAGKKLEKFDLPNEAIAQDAVRRIEAGEHAVGNVDRREARRHPPPPFTTSTLQQEASRKLGLGASQTMRIAQRLYEGIDIGGETVGLITYMRTDSVNLARDAIQNTRGLIRRAFGDAYLPAAPRSFRNTTRNAQEAHEAIRPTDAARTSESLGRHLESGARGLYELIWKRTVACQMESARLDQVTVDIAASDGGSTLRATGSVIRFDGFLKLYQESRDDPAEDGEGEGRVLPDVNTGEAMRRLAVTPDQHFTEPPPRFSEASLVKRLEELGIGRPSTYASIIQVLQDRNYARIEARRFIPEDRGRVVTAFLANFFERYVQYNFTADLEARLDDIANGRANWREVLAEFWRAFIAKVADTKDLTIRQVLDALDEDLGPHFFPDDGSGRNPRACPACAGGRLGLKLGRHGAFIGCANYPECRHTKPLAVANEANGAAAAVDRVLGQDAATGKPVALKVGRFGPYVQLGDGEAGEKPKRASLLPGMAPDTLSIATALALLALPREIGGHPDTGKPILAGVGRFGPYVRHESDYRSLGRDEDVLTVGLNRAVALLAEPKTGRRGQGAAPLKTLGDHPTDGGAITLHEGRFGPYVRHAKTIASLPKSRDGDGLTLEEAVALIEARAARAPGAAKTRKKAAPKSKTIAAPVAKRGAKAKAKAKSKAAPKAPPKAKPRAAMAAPRKRATPAKKASVA